MSQESYFHAAIAEEDARFEAPLRPQSLDEFAGQQTICERLSISMQAAKMRGEVLGHCLFSGPPGLGKTTLATLIARTMGVNCVTTSGPILDKPGDLAGVLTGLKKGDVLFIDEIHRLNRALEEYLYSAMEDFTLDLIIDSGANARSVQIKLQPFTLVGATTRLGLLTAPLRSRFPMTYRLDYYDEETLSRVIGRSARLMKLTIDEEGLREVAKRARGTPRIANNLLRWVRDFAQTRTIAHVTRSEASEALNKLAIDERGLDESDLQLLRILIDHHDGGPVGLGTLSVALGEDKQTIEEVYEPYLILQGLLRRTPRGREVTDLAYKHLERR